MLFGELYVCDGWMFLGGVGGYTHMHLCVCVCVCVCVRTHLFICYYYIFLRSAWYEAVTFQGCEDVWSRYLGGKVFNGSDYDFEAGEYEEIFKQLFHCKGLPLSLPSLTLQVVVVTEAQNEDKLHWLFMNLYVCGHVTCVFANVFVCIALAFLVQAVLIKENGLVFAGQSVFIATTATLFWTSWYLDFHASCFSNDAGRSACFPQWTCHFYFQTHQMFLRQVHGANLHKWKLIEMFVRVINMKMCKDSQCVCMFLHSSHLKLDYDHCF